MDYQIISPQNNLIVKTNKHSNKIKREEGFIKMKQQSLINMNELWDLTRYGCDKYRLQASNFYIEEFIDDINNLYSLILKALEVAPHLNNILDIDKIKENHNKNHEKTLSAIDTLLSEVKRDKDGNHPGNIKELLWDIHQPTDDNEDEDL